MRKKNFAAEFKGKFLRGYVATEIFQSVSPIAQSSPPLAEAPPPTTRNEFYWDFDPLEFKGDRQEKAEAVKGRISMGATTQDQTVKSRRGQELFKENVRLNEKGCRVTGITDPQHLRASHMKPWKDSNDDEKLNGCNGLLLAPHIDHLFDKGHISFADNGDCLISPQLDRVVLEKWGIAETTNVGRFHAAQAVFLDYHLCVIFRK